MLVAKLLLMHTTRSYYALFCIFVNFNAKSLRLSTFVVQSITQSDKFMLVIDKLGVSQVDNLSVDIKVHAQ